MKLPQATKHSIRKTISIGHTASALWRVALHHAAHGFVGSILDVPYTSITLGCTDDDHVDILLANEHALRRGADMTRAWPYVRRVLMFVLAGGVAEWHEHPDECIRINVDTSEVMAALSLLTEDATSTFIETADATRELVNANWACIERVARELVARGRLSREDVSALIKGQAVVPADCAAEGGADGN